MSSNDYTSKQSVRDAQHAKAYREWVTSLPADELARLTALGLAEPLCDDHRASGTGLDDDIANSPAASVAAEEPQDELEPSRHAEPSPDNKLPQEALWDALRRLLGEILVMPNRSLTVECLAAVSGLSYVGDSLTEIARRHGVTRAAVSKRCVELTERLNLPPSRAMRSLTARRAYREAQLRRYAKDQRC